MKWKSLEAVEIITPRKKKGLVAKAHKYENYLVLDIFEEKEHRGRYAMDLDTGEYGFRQGKITNKWKMATVIEKKSYYWQNKRKVSNSVIWDTEKDRITAKESLGGGDFGYKICRKEEEWLRDKRERSLELKYDRIRELMGRIPPEPADGMKEKILDDQQTIFFFLDKAKKLCKANHQVEISQPQISYEAYVNSYTSFLDMVLQGVMSPATLGIDLKKQDNADAQREKEKVTLHVRNKIVDTLNEVLPQLCTIILQCYDLMCGKAPGEYEPTVKFGEYAAPDFGTIVDTVGKAKQYGVMSLETSVDQMYGDTWTEEEKEAEVERLKLEQGIVDLEEPAVKLETGGFQADLKGDDSGEGKNKQPNVVDEP